MEFNSVGSSSFAQNSLAIQRSSERIASGERINSAADDAAGLAIVNRFDSQINEFSQSARNANDAISLLETAEGGLDSVTQNLQRLNELALQASNGILNDADRDALNQEASQLLDEVRSTIDNTQFNNRPILSESENISIQLDDSEAGSVELALENFSSVAEELGFDEIDLSNPESAQNALGIVADFQSQLDGASAEIGAQINRFDSSINSLLNSEVTATESRSRIGDADVAREISELVGTQVRQDASIAVQAQANESARDVLRLLSF